MLCAIIVARQSNKRTLEMNIRSSSQIRFAKYMGAFVMVLVAATFASPPYSETALAAKSPRDVYNCSDFRYQEDAQAVLALDPRDPHRLDGDKDGIACESLPRRPSSGSDPETPLIFVPGIAGTQLLYGEEFDHHSTSGTIREEKWPQPYQTRTSEEDEHLLDVRLAEDGESPYGSETQYKTRVGDILRREPRGFPDIPYSVDVYDSLVEGIEQAGYVEGQTFFPFPYDWRKDMSVVAEGGGMLYEENAAADMSLVEFIGYVREKNRRTDGTLPKVDILAHSQGGLVTLRALRDPQSTGRVRKVVTLGTPYLGSVKALSVMQYKSSCFSDAPGTSTEECTINADTLQRVVENMPGLYGLLPSRQFHEAEGSPFFVSLDEDGDGASDGEKSYDYWTGLNEGGYIADHPDNIFEERNGSLMIEADQFHDAYDDMSQSPLADEQVEMVRVVGDSLATMNSIIKSYDFSCVVYDPLPDAGCINYAPSYTSENGPEGGDETVPLHSADLYNPNNNFDLRGRLGGVLIPNLYAHNVEHGELPNNENVLAFVISYFATQDPASAPQQANSSASSLLSMRSAQAQSTRYSGTQAVTALAHESGLTTTPQPFKGIEIAISGPVSGYIKDSKGRLLGDTANTPGDSVVESIPDSNYERIGDYQSYFLNDAEGSYKSDLKVTGEGTIELKVRIYEGGEITDQAVYRLDPSNRAALNLAVTTGNDLAAQDILIDRNANGTMDNDVAPASIVAGPAAGETEAPITVATTSIAPETSRRDTEGHPHLERVLVTLSAEDGTGGSGVANTYYTLPGDLKPRRYDGPFETTLETVVRFGSVDEAGNVEAPKQILVEDTLENPQAQSLLSSEISQ